DDRAMQAIVLRMATAPEMRAVWRRLEKCPLNAHWVRIRRAGPELGIPRGANSQDSDCDVALRLFFKNACSGFWAPDSETLRRMAAEAEQYQRLAAQLRQAAASWGWDDVDEDEDEEYAEWPILRDAAAVLEERAALIAYRLQNAPGERLRGQNHV